MHTKILSVTHILAGLASLLSVFTVVLVNERPAQHSPEQATVVLFAAPHYAPALQPEDSVMRVVRRMHARLTRRGIIAPPPSHLRQALLERQKLLKQSVQVTVTPDDGTDVFSWTISLQRFPLWLTPEFSPWYARFRLEDDAVAEQLQRNPPEEIRAPTHSTLLTTFQDGRVLRAETDGVASAGYTFDEKAFAASVVRALTQGEQTLALHVAYTPATIADATGTVGNLQLIATGKSDFKGSGLGRIANIQKGLRERVHNTLVAPGETFSLNRVIGSLDAKDGWQMAMGIFNQDTLAPVLGGGLCQVATTTYRAILDGGFPVLSRRSHSLFVHYYEKYGVGLDATIYLGKQDLTFMNDTPGYLLFQAYDDGTEATVDIFGVPDGRRVALEGPYFSRTAPADFIRLAGRNLYANEIGWTQRIRYADGREETFPVVSRYKALPKGLASKFLLASQ